jgi:hypothetical protein
MDTWLGYKYKQAARIPSLLLDYGRADVASQRVRWQPTQQWHTLFAGHTALWGELRSEVQQHDGIRRSFVHAQAEKADTQPEALFLVAMAWGYGQSSLGPTRVSAMMKTANFAGNIKEIVRHAQSGGAASGWTSLLLTNRITGLNVAFGTKVLYFAGYTSDCLGPRPLILDRYVRHALITIGVQISKNGRLWRNDYLTYLRLAEQWSANPAWNETPDAVELALFLRGKSLAAGGNTICNSGSAGPGATGSPVVRGSQLGPQLPPLFTNGDDDNETEGEPEDAPSGEK